MRAVYAALTAVHNVASQADCTAELYGRACKALVRHDLYCAAWSGHVVDDGALQIAFAAGQLPVPLCDRLVPAEPLSAWQRALRTKQPVVVVRRGLPASDPMRAFAFSRALLVALTVEGQAPSLLCIAASAAEAFDTEEVALMTELGRTLSAHANRISAERQLASQRELVRAVFDCASYGMYYASKSGEIMLCNEALTRLTATTREHTVGQHFSFATPEAARAAERELIDQVMETGAPCEYDKEYEHADGFRIPVHLSVAPVRDRSGRSVGTVAIVRDTVAEREAAAALRQSEQRYRAAYRNNPDAIFVVNDLGQLVDANPAAGAMTGRARSELLGMRFLDLAAADEALHHSQALDELRDRGVVHRPLMRFVTASGSRVETEVYGTELGPGLWQLLARDIGDRLQAQRTLLALKQQLEETVAQRTVELRQANVQLAHAARMKDRFVANMSHELRTPLNAVLGLAEALQDGVYGPLDEQQRPVLATMLESGRHLLALVNDILDLTKIDAGCLELDLRSISVVEVCQTCLRMVRPMAVGKRIGTFMRADPKLRVVVADERRLKQMLFNLLSNAVKFTPAGGQVKLDAWCRDGEVYFSVSDTGIGIDGPDLRRVFEPFTQIDNSLTRKHEGTGLGLTLVRRLAELHGGTVEVDSKPGEGSRFTIVLPHEPPPERESVAEKA